jgi:hypothetical protein
MITPSQYKNPMKRSILICCLNLCSAFAFSQYYNNMDSGMGGSSRSTLGRVNALFVYNNDLYVGGGFKIAGHINAINAAKWNGSTWSAVDTNTTNNTLYLIYNAFTDYNGTLYAIGQNGVNASILKYIGNNWQVIGTGACSHSNSGNGYALASYNGKLYAGGRFDTINGVGCNGIAQWDGTSWSPVLGPTDSFGTNTTINALNVINNTLYAGGNFTSNKHNNFAAWDGTSWTGVGGGVDGGTVTSIVEYSGNIYIGGYNISLSDSLYFTSLVQKWNGTKWSDVNKGFVTDVYAMQVYNGNLVIGGEHNTASVPGSKVLGIFNGDSMAIWPNVFSQPQAPLHSSGDLGSVYSFAIYNNILYMGGYFNALGPIPYNSIVEFTNPVGIDEVSTHTGVSLYPNPVSSTLHLDHVTVGTEIYVTDILGQELIHTTADRPQMTIDVSPLRAGMYFADQMKFVKE